MNSITTASSILLGVIAFNFASAFVTARTAKSKGYRAGWFFFFSLISWYITGVIAIFLRTKGDLTAKAKFPSVVLLALGTVVEFAGLAMLPNVDQNATAEAQLAALTNQTSLGALAVAAAGALVVVAAIANDNRHLPNTSTN